MRLNLIRLVEVELQNEGGEVARSVSVKVPYLTTAQWRPDGGDFQVKERPGVNRNDVVDLGDIRPGERIQLFAWTRMTGGDSVAVYQQTGRSVIERN